MYDIIIMTCPLNPVSMRIYVLRYDIVFIYSISCHISLMISMVVLATVWHFDYYLPPVCTTSTSSLLCDILIFLKSAKSTKMLLLFKSIYKLPL